LDKTGNLISQSIVEKRMIGLHAQELRSIPNVIAVAGGNQKINAIKAALQGKWIDVLIIDSQTAKAVLETL
jgi:DNA-binding transcriptional regulator LsrR (DeoR family)